MATEPLLDVHSIQGNILAGFNKDYQVLVGLEVTDVAANKAWLAELAPHIATLFEVLSFNRLFKAMQEKRGEPSSVLNATWVNIAFSYSGIAKLTSIGEANQLPDPAFRAGMPGRSEAILGDPSDPQSPFHVSRWKVGGPGAVPDILLIIAADSEDAANQTADSLVAQAQAADSLLIYRELGQTRAEQRGHEHFGFKDGISQPGVLGRVSTAKNDYLTPRLIARRNPLVNQYSQPGRPLIMPGQFVLGYDTQSGVDGTIVPSPPLAADWHKNGSFLIFRRLRQDVAAFRRFLKSAEARLQPLIPGLDASEIGAAFVGRWPNGAPLLRSPHNSDDNMATTTAANAFQFSNAMPHIKLAPGELADTPPPAPADPLGLVCPHWAHIRKVNPRDDITNLGDSFDTLKRRMIRRGIPYGPSLPDGTDDDGIDRGLLFLAYQTSIVDSFEKVTLDWSNSMLNPQPSGHDPIIGQSDDPGRSRSVEFKRVAGESVPLEIDIEWVFPTGGGYFFAPSIEALKKLSV